MAIYLLATNKKGMSSIQLSRSIGVTQKTAWYMGHRIRRLFKTDAIVCGLGLFQCDETFVGGKNKNRHRDKKVPKSQGRSHKDKTPVVGILHVGGYLKLHVIPNVKKRTIQPIIKRLAAKGSLMLTGEWKAYGGLDKHYYHIVFDHRKEEHARGGFHTNDIEGFWGWLKRGILGIYHKVSRKHLHRYCDEFEYRYNQRKIPDKKMFDLVFDGINRRLTWKELVGVK